MGLDESVGTISRVKPPHATQGLSPVQVWWMAARPKTLSAAAAPVLVGSAMAFAEGAFHVLAALAALLGAFLLQVGTNLANDYFDFKKGADTEERVGPTRVTAAGLIAPERVRGAMVLAFLLAAIVGIYLVARGGWPLVLVGLLSIASGIAYTGGPFPLGYKGLGDVFVFVFFGLVAVAGTHYVQTLHFSWWSLYAGVPVGLLSTAILVVNNVRDVETDAKSGKGTLAVRLGEGFARREYALLVIVAYLALVPLALGAAAPGALLALLSLPMVPPLLRAMRDERGAALNPRLAETARLLAVFSALMALGLALGGGS